MNATDNNEASGGSGGGGRRFVRRPPRQSGNFVQVPIVTVDEEDAGEVDDGLNTVSSSKSNAPSSTIDDASCRPNSFPEEAVSKSAVQQRRSRRVAAVVDVAESAAVSGEDEQLLAITSSKMSREPRLSLLGRPIGLQRYRASRRDAEIRRIQARIYNFLERPKGWVSIGYHILVYV